ncbi:hypothetical protein DPMN_168831 [Dreissena polymorpha]|uniref:Uncharacterized protein n=1 Tax=Dreissena polymorpha TaxID=45954 RepID=A0A9D4IWA3_DREPO|nr:hypothetical protein DPMN_168831 [Dreissena polymorpha]
MDQRLRIAETTNREFQRSTEFLSSGFDSISVQQLKQQKHIEEQAKKIDKVCDENKSLKQSFDDIKDLHDELRTQLIDSKCREMRDNLVFTNIEEVIQTSRTGAHYTIKTFSAPYSGKIFLFQR